MTGPVNLVQGGQGIIARIPVVLGNNYKEDPYWGQVSLVIAYDVLSDKAGINQLGEELNMLIYTQDTYSNEKKICMEQCRKRIGRSYKWSHT